MATTYYVDASRPNDTGNGLSLATAKKTLNAAVNLMAGGDTLLVKAGTYNERLNTNSIPSGTGFPTGATTIQAYPGDSPTMMGNVWISAKSNIIWDGVNINGINNGIPSADSNQETYTNFYINGGSNITCRNCEIYNASKLNILTHDGNGVLSGILFSNLKVHDPGQGGWTSGTEPGNHNIYISAHTYTTGAITVNNCEVYNALGPGPASWGIHVYSTDVGFLNGVVVSNNYVHDNRQGLLIGSGDNHEVFNNVVANNNVSGSYAEAAITIGYGTFNNAQVYNNTIVGNNYAGMYGVSVGPWGNPTNSLIKNNILWQNGADSINVASGSGTVASNNLMATDPLFNTGQYTLTSGSPARGYGVNLTSVFTTDKAGNTRPSSGAWDAGAYMYVSGKTDPTLSVTNSPQTYNGSSHAATVTGSVAGTVSNVKYNGSSTVPINAGTYAITADFVPTDTVNYNSLTGASAGNFIINKATPTVSVTNSPVTYNGSPRSAAVSGSVAGTASSILTGGAATQTNVGTYAVTANFTPTDTTNYNSLSGAAAGNFVINKATPTLSVTNSPVTYDGSAKSATVTGSVSGAVTSILTGGAATQTSAGTYGVTANFTPSDTTNYNSLTAASAGNFVINKATPTLSVTNSPKTYNGSAQAATAAGSVPGTVSNIRYGGSSTAPTNAGTYAITADFAPSDTTNYNSLSSASAGNFIINKATPTLSVTNSPKTYNGSPQAATVSGSVSGSATNIKYNGSATTPTNAATYAITADFAPTDATNYSSLTGAAAGNFIINKATPTLSVMNSPQTYDGSPKTPAVSGSVAGSATGVLAGGAPTQTNVGTYPVTANFTPTDTTNYTSLSAASAGNFVIVTGAKTDTTTALASSLNPSQVGQSVTWTATVFPSAATGTVTFKEGAVTLGTGTLTGGVATFTTSALTAATHSIIASYAGDTNYNGSASGALSQNVLKISTSAALTSSLNPALNGQTVTFTATVAPSAATGTVTFQDGGVTLGTVTLTGGVATYATSALAIGPHSITATYPGDATYSGCSSPALPQTVVGKTNTSTGLVSSANPVVVQQGVSFTATVSPADATGTVTFQDNIGTLATIALTGGVATFTTAALAVGLHQMTATYTGDLRYNGSVSTTLSQVVALPSTGGDAGGGVTPGPPVVKAASAAPITMQRVQGWVEQGGTQLLITGAAGTIQRLVQGSYPLATVTVYNSATVTPATIYADNMGTVKPNPFAALADGSWFFYAPNGRYDVRFSGGGIAVPFTIGDITVFDPGAEPPPPIRDASTFPGADWGAKVQAAHDDLPLTGGEIDATGLEGAQAISTTVVLTKPTHLRVGDSTISASVLAIDIQGANCWIEGKGWASIFKMNSATSLIRMSGVSGIFLTKFRLDGAGRGFAANAITVGIGSAVTNEVTFEDLYVADVQGSALSLTSTAQFNDWRMSRCVLDNCGTATVACMNLAGLVDTARFSQNQWEGFIGTGLLASANVQRVRVFGDKFHGDVPTNTNIAIDWNGYRSAFIGCQFNFMQGSAQVICRNVDNIWTANEHTDPAATTHGYWFIGSASRNRCIANELSGPTSYIADAVRLDAVLDCQVHLNIIRNAGASAGGYGIHEVNGADRNLITENLCQNVGSPEAPVGVNSLFADNGALDSQLLVRRTQKLATGDAVAPSLAGDMRVKRTGSSLGTIQFDDGTTQIVGYRTGLIEIYVANTLRFSVNGTKAMASGIYYDTSGGYRVNNVQVVGAQGALIPDITETAGATYTVNEQQMLTDLKNDVNALLARLRAHGIIAT